MDVFTLRAILGLDTSEYDENLQGSEEKAVSFGGKLGGALGTAAKVGAAALGTVVAVGGAAGAMFVKNSGQVAEYGDNIDKMSQKMGISSTAYQEWDAIMRHSGTTIEALKPSMKTLATQAEKGSDAFAKLGISEQEVATLSQEDLFSRVITGLQNMEEGTERTYITSQLLGRGATELGALLNTSAEDTEAMRKRVHELGGVMSEDGVKAAAAYQDSLQDMQTSLMGLKNGIVSDFLPAVTEVMNGLTAIFSGEQGGGEMLSQGVSDMMDRLVEAVPQVIDAGTKIVGALLDAIIDNLPKLIESGVQILVSLITGILTALPQLIAKAPEIIITFVTAIVSAIPQLIAAGGQIISTLVDGITSNFSEVDENGQDTVTEFVTGILQKVPDVINSANDLLKRFLDKIKEKFPEILTSGITMITNLVTGILQQIPAILSSAGEIFNTFLNFIIDNFPQILSAGINLIVNLVTGILNSLPQIVNSAMQVVTTLLTTIISRFPEILENGKNIVNQIIDGIKAMFSALVENGSEIIEQVKKGINQKIEDAKNWGKHLISNFVDGIKEKWESLKESVSNVADRIAGFFEHSKPRRYSPFYGEENWFPHMFQNMAASVESSKHILTDALDMAFTGIEPDLNIGVDEDMLGGNRRNGVTVIQNIYSEAKTAAELMREAQWEQERAVLTGV